MNAAFDFVVGTISIVVLVVGTLCIVAAVAVFLKGCVKKLLGD